MSKNRFNFKFSLKFFYCLKFSTENEIYALLYEEVNYRQNEHCYVFISLLIAKICQIQDGCTI